jgi:uncharacterized protein (TIGR02301 family)
MNRLVGAWICAIWLAAAALPVGDGIAQPKSSPARPPGSTGSEPPAEPELPPYEPQLLRLAEILGALAHLRPLCGHPEGAVWRERMAQLLEAEAPAATRRSALTATFNRSFTEYGRSYRRCTPSARLILDRFLAEGTALTEDLRRRFRG